MLYLFLGGLGLNRLTLKFGKNKPLVIVKKGGLFAVKQAVMDNHVIQNLAAVNTAPGLKAAATAKKHLIDHPSLASWAFHGVSPLALLGYKEQ